MSDLANAETFLKASKDRPFLLKFIKRSNGEIREILARTGNMDMGAPGKAKARNLITVWDINDGTYKSIPVEGIVSMQVVDSGASMNSPELGDVEER